MIPLEIVAMLICFACMVLITVHGSKSAEDSGNKVDESTHTSKELILGYSIMFVTSWVYASNCIMNRALKGINSGVIMFWHGILGVILAVIATLIAYFAGFTSSDGFTLFNYTAEVYGLMIGGAIVDTITVNSMTISF